MSTPGPAPIPWWLVPNLLALDAPAVAVVWQRFLAGCSGVTVPWAASAALAAAVWCVYLADRWLDARRGKLDAARHHAAARHPVVFAIGVVLAAALAAVAAVQLPIGYVEYGFAVGLGVSAYLALVHALAPGLGVKEFLVGVGFAAGVAAPLGVEARPVHDWLPGVVAFGALCWLNCRLIDHWESEGAAHPDWPDGLLVVAVVGAGVYLPTAVGLAVGAAVVGQVVVHFGVRHHARAARVLADVALLTPLAWWGVP